MFDIVLQCGVWCDSFITGALQELGKHFVSYVLALATAAGWSGTLFDWWRERGKTHQQLKADAEKRVAALKNASPLSREKFFSVASRFDSDLYEALRHPLSKFKADEMPENFRRAFQGLREQVPDEGRIAAAFAIYDIAVASLLSRIDIQQRKSKTIRAMFDEVKDAFTRLASALERPLEAKAKEQYDARTIKVGGTQFVLSLFSMTSHEAALLKRRRPYLMAGVPESAFADTQ